MAVVRRIGDSRFEVRFEPGEAELLSNLPDQFRELVTKEDGRVHERLFPRAYFDPDEGDAEAEWQRLMHAELLAGKLEALDVLQETLRRASRVGDHTVVELGGEELDAWVRAINDARLALGVMLDVTEDLDWSRVSPDEPGAAGLHLYGWLTWLQGELIEAVNP